MSKLISVVTIVYNDFVGVEKTIRSVLPNLNDSIEFIVIDGASNDGTLDIIRKYNDNIDVLVSEPDKGIYDAMNKGLSFATGDWVIFMNAGDIFSPVPLSDYINNFISKDKLYFGRAKIIANDSVDWLYPDNYINDGNIELWLKRHLPNHQAMFFPKKFYSVNRFDKSIQISSDSDYKLRVLQSLDYEFVDIEVCQFDYGGLSSELSFNSLLTQCKERYKRTTGQGGVVFALEGCIKSLIKLTFSKLLGGYYLKVVYKVRRHVDSFRYK